MAGSSPYGPVVLHQDKASSAGDASSVNSMATRSSTHRSRPLSTASTDSDASSAMSNAWSDKATAIPFGNAKCRANSHTGLVVSVCQH